MGVSSNITQVTYLTSRKSYLVISIDPNSQIWPMMKLCQIWVSSNISQNQPPWLYSGGSGEGVHHPFLTTEVLIFRISLKKCVLSIDYGVSNTSFFTRMYIFSVFMHRMHLHNMDFEVIKKISEHDLISIFLIRWEGGGTIPSQSPSGSPFHAQTKASTL